MTILMSRRARREYRAGQYEVDALVYAWRRACEGAGLFQQVDAAAGPTIITPRIVDVRLGPPLSFTAELLPGQLPGDVRRVSSRLAPHIGVPLLAVHPFGHRHVRLQALDCDPLDGDVPLIRGRGVHLGRDEAGAEITEHPMDLPHALVQGVTRSGKSVWTYGLLANVAHDPLVTLAGVDPTGLLFRPLAGSRHTARLVSGLGDLGAPARLLGQLTAEMDRRIAALPLDRDTLEISPEQPLIMVVLEEYPGLLRVLDSAKTKNDDPGKIVRSLVSRLLAEGHKVGLRVLIMAQRAEAAVVGAFERAMCSLRLSFRCDNRAAVELLHPGVDGQLADQHTTAAPGIALVTMPGKPLRRIRGPYLGGYAEFSAAVA